MLKTGMKAFNELLKGGFQRGNTYCLVLPNIRKTDITLLDIIYQLKKYNGDYKTKNPNKKPCILYVSSNFSKTNVKTIVGINMEQDIAKYGKKIENNITISSRGIGTDIMNYRTCVIEDYMKCIDNDGYETICIVHDDIMKIYTDDDIKHTIDTVTKIKEIAVNNDIPFITATDFDKNNLLDSDIDNLDKVFLFTQTSNNCDRIIDISKLGEKKHSIDEVSCIYKIDNSIKLIEDEV